MSSSSSASARPLAAWKPSNCSSARCRRHRGGFRSHHASGPHRESLLAEIIGRPTKMPVVNATHGARLQPGHVYVLPAEHVLTLQGSELILQHLEAGQRERNPIDVFFTSIAKQRHERSVGIVLSGAGTDGTLGIKAIKEEGGLTIAQGHGASGPAYDSMPSSAVASGLVDLVLPVEEIGTKLQQYVRSLDALDAIADDADERPAQSDRDGALQEIYAVLRNRIGHDFSGYKEKTFLRRVQRRMQVRQLDSLAGLRRAAAPGRRGGAAAVSRSADRRHQLLPRRRGVRGARDRGHPASCSSSGADDTVRIWVPGCATGEEAYSLAILMREHMEQARRRAEVQVFATDIDEPALLVARAGALSRADAGQRLAGAAEAVLHAGRAELRAHQGGARHVHLLRAQRDPRSAVLAHGPDLVPQPADLFRRRSAGQRAAGLPLCAQAERLSCSSGPAENISRHTDLFAPSTRSIGSSSAADAASTAARAHRRPGCRAALAPRSIRARTSRLAQRAAPAPAHRSAGAGAVRPGAHRGRRRRRHRLLLRAHRQISRAADGIAEPADPGDGAPRACGWSCARRCARRSRSGTPSSRERVEVESWTSACSSMRLTVQPLVQARPGAAVPGRVHGPGSAADSRGSRAAAAAPVRRRRAPAWSTSCAKRASACRRPSRNTRRRSRS